MKKISLLIITILVATGCSINSTSKTRDEVNILQTKQSSGSGIPRKNEWLYSENLRGLDLSGLDLSDTVLEWKDLTGVKVIRSTLNQASLHGACLREALFSDSSLRGVDLTAADCRNAQFIRTDLRGSKMVKTDMSDSLMIQVDMSFSDLTDIKLTGAKISGAIISKKWKPTLESSGVKKLEDIIWVE